MDPRDAGKKIKGRKRHALTDTDGRALLLEPHSAGIQDRDAAGPVLQASRSLYQFIEHLFADSRLRRELVAKATDIEVEIVRKIADQVGFRPAATALGRRALLRLDQPQPSPRQGRRGDDRLCSRLPLRSRRHAACATHCEGLMSSRTGSHQRSATQTNFLPRQIQNPTNYQKVAAVNYSDCESFACMADPSMVSYQHTGRRVMDGTVELVSLNRMLRIGIQTTREIARHRPGDYEKLMEIAQRSEAIADELDEIIGPVDLEEPNTRFGPNQG